MSKVEYKKTCPGCKKAYTTPVRHQKYCGPDCRVKHMKRLKVNRKWSSSRRSLLRLKSRSHAIAVEIVKYKYASEDREWQCSECEEKEGLEVHHIDLNFFNNTPANLDLLCRKHHAQAHSKILKDCKDAGLLIKTRYDESFYAFVGEILKEPTVRIQRLKDKQWLTQITDDGLQIWHKHKSKGMEIKESDPFLERFFCEEESKEEYIKV